MSQSWRSSFDAVEVTVLPPDPDVVKAIGLSHNMTSALADLVDNCLDAEATKVRIRFVQLSGRLKSLLVIDNGRGMDDQGIDAAMTVGRRRRYETTSLGHFGMGLKSASFSQADTLTVLSMSARRPAAGRRWRRNDIKDFRCEVLDREQATRELDSTLSIVGSRTGTMVRWDDVRTFPVTSDRAVTDEYLSRTVQELRVHLGLVLHQLLVSSLEVIIDVFDADTGTVGPPRTVNPINPFGYRQSGHPGYPKVLSCTIGGHVLPIEAHIWPARSTLAEFRLDGNTERRQGFYFYRNNRLVEAGGWKHASRTSRRTQLARVSVDISAWSDVFEINMEKSTVHPRPEFIAAVECASAPDGSTFTDYLDIAEAVYREGNRRTSTRRAVLPPGKGIAPAVKRAVRDELPLVTGGDSVAVKWTTLSGEEFFLVDRDANTLWLNRRYRSAMLGGRRGGSNDLPVLKSLLYLLFEDIFHGEKLGARDKDNIEIWQSILIAAATAEAGA